MAEEPTTTGSTNGSTAVAKLLSQLNLPTLVAILFMNGWGIQTTQQKGQELSEEQRTVYRQVRDLHDALDKFEQRQKEALAKATSVIENQSQLLHNQSVMISNQQQLLSKLQKAP